MTTHNTWAPVMDRNARHHSSQPAAVLEQSMTGWSPPSPFPPEPTHADLSYGHHERHSLDLWLAERDGATPLVVFIHGGGFTSGDKSEAKHLGIIEACLTRGFSFASINYRFLSHAPVQHILQDVADAIAYLRKNADLYNLDTQRLGAFGDSAGAGAALWLAFAQDTPLACCAASRPQASYDLREWCALVGQHPDGRTAESECGFYHLPTPDYHKDEIDEMLHDLSMLNRITADAPPTLILTTDDLSPATTENEYLHHPKHAHVLHARCQRRGADSTLQLIGDHPVSPAMAQAQFLMERLDAAP
ncbi:MAG: alpha/beta hydrolase family protein [Planctomycetota bacterium]|jgi:acetyl esterase/lipase